MNESAFIDSLRGLVSDPAARNLLDDAAVLEIGGTRLVLTHDMIVEGVHFLSADAPEDVAWKLLAVNLSDLAAKGARPLGALLGYSLAMEDAWNAAFVRGLSEALSSFNLPLLGGDTVSVPPGAPRSLGLTAIGEATDAVPTRGGARAGDLLYVTGTIGDAGGGLRIALGECEGPAALVERYRRPLPRLAAGQALAPLVSAMMDVSDGLLIDAARMAHASGLAVAIDLDRMPLSREYRIVFGEDRRRRIDAAIAGDDYELLFAIPKSAEERIAELGKSLGLPLTRIGSFAEGTGLSVRDQGADVPLPQSLGYEHRGH